MSDVGKLFITGVVCLGLGAVAGNYLPFKMQTAENGTKVMQEINADKVKAIVADYIAENPEKLVESLQGLQQREFIAQQEKTAAGLEEHLPAVFDDTNSPTVGTGGSGIVIAEFFDYKCGYCKRMAGTVQKLLKKHPDVKIVFKEMPILSEGSRKAAKASLAVSYLASDRYMEYHMMLMQHQGEYTDDALKDYAGQLGIDVDAFLKEMNGDRVAKEIAVVADVAQKIGARGTPALVVGGELIPGAVPFEQIDARIADLKKK